MITTVTLITVTILTICTPGIYLASGRLAVAGPLVCRASEVAQW